MRAEDSTLPPAYAAMSLSPGDAAYEVVLDCHGTQVALEVGDGTWESSTLAVGGVELPVVASGGWDGDGCFTADIRLIETPHTVQLRTRTDGTRLPRLARGADARSGAAPGVPCGDRPYLPRTDDTAFTGAVGNLCQRRGGRVTG